MAGRDESLASAVTFVADPTEETSRTLQFNPIILVVERNTGYYLACSRAEWRPARGGAARGERGADLLPRTANGAALHPSSQSICATTAVTTDAHHSASILIVESDVGPDTRHPQTETTRTIVI